MITPQMFYAGTHKLLALATGPGSEISSSGRRRNLICRMPVSSLSTTVKTGFSAVAARAISRRVTKAKKIRPC
jgi:hypothetical protein